MAILLLGVLMLIGACGSLIRVRMLRRRAELLQRLKKESVDLRTLLDGLDPRWMKERKLRPKDLSETGRIREWNEIGDSEFVPCLSRRSFSILFFDGSVQDVPCTHLKEIHSGSISQLAIGVALGDALRGLPPLQRFRIQMILRIGHDRLFSRCGGVGEDYRIEFCSMPDPRVLDQWLAR